MTETLPVDSQIVATFNKVIDGDSILLDYAGDTLKVRLWNIDTPQSKTKPAQPYARETTSVLKRLMKYFVRANVQITVKGTDRYGRLLVVLEVKRIGYDNNAYVDVAKTLLRYGLARVYSSSTDAGEYAELERTAKDEKIGLWADPVYEPIDPKMWRAVYRAEGVRGVRRLLSENVKEGFDLVE